MTVLHLFDLHLPHTMNWVSELMLAMPEVDQWVAAPWIVHNEYHRPDFRFFTHPIQQSLGLFPANEWQAAWFSANLIRAERRFPLYRNWLFSQLKHTRPDVLHAHFAPVGCHYLELAQKLNIPMVVSFYGFDYQRLPFEKPIYRERYNRLFESAAAITTTGELTPQLLIKQGCQAGKISAIPLSIDPAAFPFWERTKKPGQLRLVQIATITEKKGHLDALKALRIALHNCPNMHLTIAGERQDKDLFHSIQQFINANDLSQHVTLLDFLPHRELPHFLRQFDVFFHPSRTAANGDCEGAPVVLLEAQSTGLPVIATIHSDIPMQVVNGETGLLAPERDPKSLATCLEAFYHKDNQAYQAMSRAAHAHVAEHFDVKNTVKKLQTLYKSIV